MGKSGNWSTSLMWHFRVFGFSGLWYVGLIQRAYPRNEGSKLQYQANHHGDLVRYIMIYFDLELTLWYWLGFVQKMDINWVQPGGRRCTALFRRGKGNELLDCWVLVTCCFVQTRLKVGRGWESNKMTETCHGAKIYTILIYGRLLYIPWLWSTSELGGVFSTSWNIPSPPSDIWPPSHGRW